MLPFSVQDFKLARGSDRTVWKRMFLLKALDLVQPLLVSYLSTEIHVRTTADSCYALHRTHLSYMAAREDYASEGHSFPGAMPGKWSNPTHGVLKLWCLVRTLCLRASNMGWVQPHEHTRLLGWELLQEFRDITSFHHPHIQKLSLTLNSVRQSGGCISGALMKAKPRGIYDEREFILPSSNYYCTACICTFRSTA
jgi:hypothetical protein